MEKVFTLDAYSRATKGGLTMRLKDFVFTVSTGGLYLIWKQILED